MPQKTTDTNPLSACSGKVAYATKGEAIRAIERMYKRKGNRRRDPMVVYRCPVCHQWHQGHAAPKAY